MKNFLPVFYSFLLFISVKLWAQPQFYTQPQPQTTAVGDIASFCVEVFSEFDQVSFQWRRNGVSIAGATRRCFVLSSTAAANAGNYTVRVTDADGFEDSDPALLTVKTASSTLANGVDNVGQFWWTAGDSPVWARTTTVADTHDGADAARAVGLAVGEITTLGANILGPGFLSFWWRCGGDDFDYLEFKINDFSYDSLYGGTPYTLTTWYLPPGFHTVDWTYYEDWDGDANVAGRGLLDQVTFVPTSFGAWQNANFSLQSRIEREITAPSEDPNNDGLNNLQAYAFGIHPLTGGGRPLPYVVKNGTERSLIYQKNILASDVTYVVEETTDLEAAWWDVETPESVIGTNGNLRTMKAMLPNDLEENVFYRLRLDQEEIPEFPYSE